MPASETKNGREELFAELGRLDNDAARDKFVARHKAVLVSKEAVLQLAELVVEKIRVDTRTGKYMERA